MSECKIPPELTEDQISALIDGETDPHSQQHILQCPYCADRLAQAQRIEKGLHMALFRKDCPTSFELAQHHMDMLDSPEDRSRIDSHLQTCRYCQHDLQDWERFIDESSVISESLDAAAKKVRPMHNPERIVLFPRIASQPRSAVRGDARVNRIIATADSTTIRLSFETLPDDKIKLTIQLSSPEVDWRGAMVNVRQGNSTVAVCRINTYQIGTCVLPRQEKMTLRFVSTDETLIEFKDVSP
jgi:hypothetical protein